jgi:activator of HSP90 ATPase
MKNRFTISAVIPAKASDLYRAWLSSEGHAAMTGNPAKVDGKAGGKFRAWRTSEFPEEAPDSRLEILFEKVTEGTKVTLIHSDMPEDQIDSYRQGWEDFYFKPMKEYFSKQ